MTDQTKNNSFKRNLNYPDYYINRELSMIAFQERVFEEATDLANPLLERVKFLAFVGLNLDEFFMVRVGGLKMQLNAGITSPSIDGRTPAQQLVEIRKSAYSLMKNARSHWAEELQPALAKAGVEILNYKDLNQKQKNNADDYFKEVVFPVLTPLAFDPGHPFPHISNLSLNLAVLIKDQNGQQHFARVKVPHGLERLVPIKRSSGATKKDGTVPPQPLLCLVRPINRRSLKYALSRYADPRVSSLPCYPQCRYDHPGN